MNFIFWLKYLESLPSGLSNNSLANVKNVAQKLGLLEKFSKKIIIVSGTNGKGSCVIFLESILLAAGLQTGAFISPHVLKYNERVRLNGKDIDDEALCQAFAQIDNARGDTILSYFEFSTLAALYIFKKQKVEILILEVGLGGRFDAVNILDADIAIITTISLDHIKILGSTREAIGYEKAGIMRAFKPVICGDINIPESIYTEAKKTKAILYLVNEVATGFGLRYIKTKLPVVNAKTAIVAIKLLQKDLSIPKKAIITGLKKAFLLGRMQHIIIDNKNIIFDVAHNPESAALLAQNLAKHPPKGRILAVVSMLGDKDITATMQILTKTIDKWYLSVLIGTRAASAEQLVRCLVKAGGLYYVILPTIAESLQRAIAECGIKDRIVVFGSFHTVAEGLRMVFNFTGEKNI